MVLLTSTGAHTSTTISHPSSPSLSLCFLQLILPLLQVLGHLVSLSLNEVLCGIQRSSVSFQLCTCSSNAARGHGSRLLCGSREHSAEQVATESVCADVGVSHVHAMQGDSLAAGSNAPYSIRICMFLVCLPSADLHCVACVCLGSLPPLHCHCCHTPPDAS